MTQRINKAEKARLEEVRRKFKLKSASDAIKFLLDQHDGEGDANDSDSDSGEPVPMEMDEEQKKKKKAMWSYEQLAEEPKALKFFTGLREGSMIWVLRVLKLAVRALYVFLCFCIWNCAALSMIGFDADSSLFLTYVES